jgi:hypothetical protein
VRLVPVSISGAPACGGPGTGLSTALGAGGGGGSTGTGAVGLDSAPAAVVTEIGPVTAPTGTRALMRVSAPGRTGTSTSSASPKLPWKTTFFAAASPEPVILRVLPPCARLPEAHLRRQVTFETLGVATYTPPPPPEPGVCAAAPGASAHRLRASAPRQRPATTWVSRNSSGLSSLRPTGLADGLAPEERRYHRVSPADSPLR